MGLPAVEPKREYEEALRVIGRQLDAEPAYHVSILEVPEGFTVRFRPSQQVGDIRTLYLNWDRIQDLNVWQSAGRGLSRKHGRRQGIWAELPGGHIDFFRALGAMLDERGGTNLTLDEIQDGIAISYLYPVEGDRLRTEKFHAVLTPEDIHQMVESARLKREERAAAAENAAGH